MSVNLVIPTLGNKFVDYRDPIPGDSYNWGPAIDAGKVKYFSFHHSVTAQTAKNDGNWKAECDKIADLHIDGRKWEGIGYRFLICSDSKSLSSRARSMFKIFPRRGSIACVRLSRPVFAVPPAESPSTINSSESSADFD